MIVAGIDLSLTSTGIAIINGHLTSVCRITSTGRKNATTEYRHRRLHNLCLDIGMAIADAELVVIEGPSYAQAHAASQHDRSGLWWMLVDFIDGYRQWDEFPIVEVPPTCRAKYATGRGNASKDAVLAAACRRYPNIDISGNDVADAVILAAMGSRWAGQVLEETLPKTHLAGMDGVHWPDRTEQAGGAA